MTRRSGARAAAAAAAVLVGAVLLAPATAQGPAFTQVGTIPGPADLVDVHGDRAYVIGGGTIRIFDVSKPAAPALLGSYTFPEKVWGTRLVGTKLYAAADFFGLGILDVSNPRTPVLVGSLKTPGQAKNVAVFGTKAAVADHMSGVDFIETADATKPTLLGSFFLEGYARDVASGAGSLAYAIDSPFGLYVFDLSQPGAPDPVSSQQTATSPGSLVVAEGGDGPKVAVLLGGGSVQVYDLSKPTAPARVATVKTPGGRAARATLSGSRVYVADGREGLQVLDLSTPKAPRLVGSHKTAHPARDVAIAGPLVFVVVGSPSETPREFEDQEVLILRQSS